MQRIVGLLAVFILVLPGCSATRSAGHATCAPNLNCGTNGACATGGSGCPRGGCAHHGYCAPIDSWRTRCLARKHACAALRRGSPTPSCHFREGFVCAYVDIAEGGTGVPPALAPCRYWNVCQRTECGRVRAADWFEGYRAGVQQARADGEPGQIFASTDGWSGPATQESPAAMPPPHRPSW